MARLQCVLSVAALAALVCLFGIAAADDNQLALGHWIGTLTGTHDYNQAYLYVFNENKNSWSYKANDCNDSDYWVGGCSGVWNATYFFNGAGKVYFRASGSIEEPPTVGLYEFVPGTNNLVMNLAINDAGKPIPSNATDTTAEFQSTMSKLFNVPCDPIGAPCS